MRRVVTRSKSRLNLKTTEEVKTELLRSWDDFLLSTAFQTPDFLNLESWAAKVRNNLTYYQKNYMVMSLLIFVIFMLLHPVEMIQGMLLLIGVVIGYYYLGRNQAAVNDFNKKYPYADFAFFAIVVYLLLPFFGAILIFVFASLVPIAVIFIHSSLRVREPSERKLGCAQRKGQKVGP